MSFLAFHCDSYDTDGGMFDCIGTFEDIDSAKKALAAITYTDTHQHILDCDTLTVYVHIRDSKMKTSEWEVQTLDQVSKNV